MTIEINSASKFSTGSLQIFCEWTGTLVSRVRLCELSSLVGIIATASSRRSCCDNAKVSRLGNFSCKLLSSSPDDQLFPFRSQPPVLRIFGGIRLPRERDYRVSKENRNYGSLVRRRPSRLRHWESATCLTT